MFVSLVKINKYLIYLFLFLFFNCIFISCLKAADTTNGVKLDNDDLTDAFTGRLLRSITFNNDGTKMFVSGILNDRIVQYDLSTGYDLSTISEGDQLLGSDNTKIANPYSLRFNNDGTKMFFIVIKPAPIVMPISV